MVLMTQFEEVILIKCLYQISTDELYNNKQEIDEIYFINVIILNIDDEISIEKSIIGFQNDN